MTIKHHPDVATLLSCSAGSQPEAFAAVMAAHISMCPQCAGALGKMDEIGCTLFEDLEPAHVKRQAPVVASRANEATDETAPGTSRSQGDIPAPLVPILGSSLADVKWQHIGPGVWQYRIPMSKGARGDLRLLKIAPGVSMPDHGHSGTELTLLLAGSYRDRLGHFRKGDVADVDQDVEHQPIADPSEGCICLVATEGKARFKSVLARLVQPFIGM